MLTCATCSFGYIIENILVNGVLTEFKLCSPCKFAYNISLGSGNGYEYLCNDSCKIVQNLNGKICIDKCNNLIYEGQLINYCVDICPIDKLYNNDGFCVDSCLVLGEYLDKDNACVETCDDFVLELDNGENLCIEKCPIYVHS